jgi:hypothetical protein
MKERAKELKNEHGQISTATEAEGEVLAKIAEMPDTDRMNGGTSSCID